MGRLIENDSITKKNPKDKIYCHEDYAQELYDKFTEYFSGRTISSKDMEIGTISQAKIVSMDDSRMIAQTDSFQSILLDYPREAKFIEKNKSNPLRPGMIVDVLIEGVNKGNFTGSIEKAFVANIRKDLFKALKEQNVAYEVTIKSVNDGGFLVDLSGIECFMPGSLAAANKIIDFKSMLGKKVRVMVETYLDQSDMFVVSNKKYIQHILPEQIKKLDLSKEYSGTITGVMAYGTFVEWNDIFTGLLHETETVDPNWKAIKSGTPISFWIKEIKENKIILSQKGPAPENVLYQEFKDKYEGEIFGEATIKDIKPFGIFVDMKGIVGMLTPREFKKTNCKALEGEYLDVLVKEVDVHSRKVYLKAEETE